MERTHDVHHSIRYGYGRYVTYFDPERQAHITYVDHNSPGDLSNARWLDDNGNGIAIGDPRDTRKKPKLSVDCSGGISDRATVIFSIFRANSNTDIPRERLQGTNRRNVTGAVPAGTAEEKWEYKYLDDDYDKSTKFIFEVSTHGHGKIECPDEFDTGWQFLTESGIKNAESLLRQGLTKKSFKRLINRKTGKLAEIILANNSLLDNDARMYIDSLWFKKCGIKKILNSITVYDGVDAQLANPAFNSLSIPNLFMDPDLAALSLGKNIYFKRGVLPQVMDQSTAALLVHEAIHSIQVRGFGLSVGRKIRSRDKRARFVTFCLNNEYNEINEYEVAAYNFGGGINGQAFPDINECGQVMFRNKYQNWWL